MTIVIDASALVDFLLRAPQARPVGAAVATGDAIAPELLDAEVLSGLRRLVRLGGIEEGHALRLVRSLSRVPITRTSHRGLLEQAWRRRHRVSAYDALYVALAYRMSCPLLTTDHRLARAGDLGVQINLLPTE